MSNLQVLMPALWTVGALAVGGLVYWVASRDERPAAPPKAKVPPSAEGRRALKL